MQRAGRYREAGKPTFASALRARGNGWDPIPRKALWPAANVRRINRSNTWPHRPTLQNRSIHSCQRRAVHTWRFFAVPRVTHERQIWSHERTCTLGRLAGEFLRHLYGLDPQRDQRGSQRQSSPPDRREGEPLSASSAMSRTRALAVTARRSLQQPEIFGERPHLPDIDVPDVTRLRVRLRQRTAQNHK